MPYIKKEDRISLIKPIEILTNEMRYSCSPGDLNFIITNLIHFYVDHKGKNYTHLNDVVGVLESAKAEFQRRVVAPYEDEKIEQNGDI